MKLSGLVEKEEVILLIFELMPAVLYVFGLFVCLSCSHKHKRPFGLQDDLKVTNNNKKQVQREEKQGST